MLSAEIEARLLGYLREDAGTGDVTSEITPQAQCRAEIMANEKCMIAGIEETVFLLKNVGLNATAKKKDGQWAVKGEIIMEVRGSNRKILTLERVCLNVLGRMSGVATLCAKAKEIAGGDIKGITTRNKISAPKKTQRPLPVIAVTRKTVPGFQLLDKKAAEVAGCWTHRKNLSEMILLKDNHLTFFPDTLSAAQKAKATGQSFEVEAENKAQALHAAAAQPDILMLDNFTPQEARLTIRALRKKGYRGKIELSGGITLKNLKGYGNIGADIISMGELTKKARIVDFSLGILMA